MVEYGSEYQGLIGAARALPDLCKVSIIPLMFLLIYEVSGGPFGIEDSVNAAGRFLSIIGFLVLPVLWSIQEALIWLDEMVGWCHRQCPLPCPLVGPSQVRHPCIRGRGPRALAAIGLTVLLTLMNYKGLSVVGWVAICLGVFSILPFVLMGFVALLKIRPSRWLVGDLHNVDWDFFLNTLFWNPTYCGSIGTLSGEVESPKKTLPKALLYNIIFVVVSYCTLFSPAMVQYHFDRKQWTNGYLSNIAKMLWRLADVVGSGGHCIVQHGDVCRRDEANLTSFLAWQGGASWHGREGLLGMAERGRMLPALFAKRSPYGTPLIGIIFFASSVLLLSPMSFQEMVAAENFLYCLAMLLEFVAFITLRVKNLNVHCPFKVPLGTVSSVLMLVPPTAMILLSLHPPP